MMNAEESLAVWINTCTRGLGWGGLSFVMVGCGLHREVGIRTKNRRIARKHMKKVLKRMALEDLVAVAHERKAKRLAEASCPTKQ